MSTKGRKIQKANISISQITPRGIQEALIRTHLEMLMAIETLEFHGKKYLAGSDRAIREAKGEIIRECLSLINDIIEKT